MGNLWFSYTQEKYEPKKKSFEEFWTKEKSSWNWDNCRFTLIPLGNQKVRVVIRRRERIYSRFKQREISVDSMMSVIVIKFERPKPVSEALIGNNIPQTENQRQVIKLKIENDLEKDDRPLDQCEIWQLEGERDDSLENLFEELEYVSKKPRKEGHDVIFDTGSPPGDRLIPVIYQPYVDAWKNFLREIHCHNNNNGYYDISLVFNDGRLRKHWVFDWPYRLYRKIRYGRIKDIESFKIKSENNVSTHFIFEDIHSGDYCLYYDSIHEDEPPAPERPILHWYLSKNNPVVFVNTSNHAMAEYDNNHTHWKWEYVAWEKDSPIKYGNKSRKQLDDEYS